MKRIIALALVIVCVLALSACNQEENEDILHLGINAEIVEIDTDNQIVYVVDFGEEKVSSIQFADLAVGDNVTINAYESQLSRITDA